MTRITLLTLTLLVLGGREARAQRVVLHDQGGTPALADLRAQAAVRIGAELELARFDVASPEDVGVEAFAALMRCDNSTCTAPILEMLDVDFALVVTMWTRLSGERLLEATVFPRAGASRIISVHVDGDSIEEPVRELVRQVIEADPGAPLEPVAEVAPARPGERRRSIANFVIGGAFIAASIAPLALGIRSASRDGECTDVDPTRSNRCVVVGPPDSPRYEVHDFGAGGVTALSVGLASLATGAIFLAVRPVRVTADVSSTGAAVRLSARF